MKRLTLWDRASRAVCKHGLPRRLWLNGHAAGVRDAGKALKPLKRRLLDAMHKANHQHERARKAEHEANIVRIKAERQISEFRKKEHELRIKYEQNEYKRAGILQSRLPLNNGGFYR